jgi:hypothetical protein
MSLSSIAAPPQLLFEAGKIAKFHGEFNVLPAHEKAVAKARRRSRSFFLLPRDLPMMIT